MFGETSLYSPRHRSAKLPGHGRHRGHAPARHLPTQPGNSAKLPLVLAMSHAPNTPGLRQRRTPSVEAVFFLPGRSLKSMLTMLSFLLMPAEPTPSKAPMPYAEFRKGFFEAQQRLLEVQEPITLKMIQTLQQTRKYARSPVLAMKRA